ncbi:conserved Plasmodium protein, unknown function [Plasmodium chabaudi chabaudi]|uniref:Uncharacterized protein n=1 Tax=Plasmodium chabaudi chabaudi TaxID=31271 RepID=A0A1C6XBV5_PLACU|nr:conserved Plasmodium protein, unknown function [Plasmodium chabaudi chabaudi]
MRFLFLASCFLWAVLNLFFVWNKKIITLKKNAHILNPIKKEIPRNWKKNSVLNKINFIFYRKKNQYEMKNLENIPLFVVTNKFDEVILSFDPDYGTDDQAGKNTNTQSVEYSNTELDHNLNEDIVLENYNNSLLFPVIKKNEQVRKEIDLNKIHNNDCIGIFFFDLKTAEAYKDDIANLYNKNLKDNNKVFFGSKVKFTNLDYFLKLKKSLSSKVDFVLIPNYNELQNVLKNKKIFYGTPIYYINKITLRKSTIKKTFYELFFRTNLKKVKVELYPNIFITYTIKEEYEKEGQETEKEIDKGEKKLSLYIQLETLDKKKYIPIFFSYEHAYYFYKLFIANFKSHFTQYILPKPQIILNSFESLLMLLNMANDNKLKEFHNLFFVPTSHMYDETLYSTQTNVFTFYFNKFVQKIKYDLFRSFRKNLNYLISDYLYP